MDNFIQNFLDTNIYRFLAFSDYDKPEKSQNSNDYTVYAKQKPYWLQEKEKTKSKIMNMFNDGNLLNKILNSKVNEVPLFFLIKYVYSDIIDDFKANKESKFKQKYIEKVIDAQDTLRDDFGNMIGFYVPKSRSPIKTYGGKFNKDGSTFQEYDYPLEGFVLRSFKSKLAFLNVIEKVHPPKDYNHSYIKENVQRIKNFPNFYDNEQFNGDFFQYIFGQSKEDQIFSWDLIDIVPQNKVFSSYKDIIKNFGMESIHDFDEYPDEDDITFMSFNTIMNNKQDILKSTIPSEILPKMLPYVVNNLHYYLRNNKDNEKVRNQMGTKYLTLAFITSCQDKKLLDQFSSYLEQAIHHYYRRYHIKTIHYEPTIENDEILVDILKAQKAQYNKIEINQIETVGTKQKPLKNRKIFNI
jgi:hypothetical protein